MTYRSTENIPCVICGKKSKARKLCSYHYEKTRRSGDIDKYPIVGPEDVFEGRIKKTEYCWEWLGTKNDFGYGIFLLPGEKPVRAHRYAYEFWVGKIPEGKIIMHKCDNPICVNPQHLEIGTKLENNRDAHSKGHRTRGEKSHLAKLTDEQAKAILADQRSHQKIADDYGVNQSTVSRIKSGDRRKFMIE